MTAYLIEADNLLALITADQAQVDAYLKQCAMEKLEAQLLAGLDAEEGV